jgi:hypothetical protein
VCDDGGSYSWPVFIKQTSSVDIACSTVTPSQKPFLDSAQGGPSVTGDPCNGKPRSPRPVPSLPQSPTHHFENHSIDSIDAGATDTSSMGDHRGSLFVCG